MELVSWKPWGGFTLRPELKPAGLGGAVYLPERNISDCFVCFGPSGASGLFAMERPVTGPSGATPLGVGGGLLGARPGSNKFGPKSCVCAADLT